MSDSWNTDALSADAQYREVETDGAITSIRFTNESYLGSPTEVFAYMGMPETAGESVPGIVCVHGGGGTAFKHWVEAWVERGYAAIAMDLSGRGPDRERLPNAGPDMEGGVLFSTSEDWQNTWTHHAVAAVIRAHTILQSQELVDPEHVGITGISWGGYVTCIAAAMDTRFACAIPVYGCGFLQDGSADTWMERFAEMTEADRKTWHDFRDPSVYLKHVEMPMMFVSGTNDACYPFGILMKSCTLPQGPVTLCVRHGMGHSHEAGWAPEEIARFADHHLRNGPPLPTIDQPVLDDRHLHAKYSSTTSVVSAQLIWTADTGKWQERTWNAEPATHGDDVASATLPPSATHAFLAIEDDRGTYVSSFDVESQA